MADSEKDGKNSVEKRQTPALEWILAVIGLILVVGVVGFLLYHAFTDEQTPPDISVKIESVAKNKNGYLVQFVIKNEGGKTAADITVEGELKKGEENAETSDVTVDYVASKSEKKGGLMFTKNPSEYDIQLRAKGFNAP